MALKRAVAAALVLIAGAAVVLWFGNTLNSWVLGGLIGGLAALLISIPISLIIFSFFARKHDERREQEEYEHYQQVRLARQSVYQEEVYEDGGYAYEEQPAIDERYTRSRSYRVVEEDHYRDRRSDRRDEQYEETPPARQLSLPPPSRVPRERTVTRHFPAVQHEDYAALPGQPLESNGREIARRRLTQRRSGSPGMPGYQGKPTRSQLRTRALRAAQQEAASEAEFQITSGPSTLRRQNAIPLYPPSVGEVRRPTRKLPHRASKRDALSSRRPADAFAQNDDIPDEFFDDEEETSIVSQRQAQFIQDADPETEYLAPQTFSGDLRKPLQRRAPYIYEDDELPQGMAQPVEPRVRRASRYLKPRQNS